MAGGSPQEATSDAQAEPPSPIRCSARICWPSRRECPKCRTGRRPPIPAGLSRRGCPATAAGQNAAAARIAVAHRIGGQRVEPAAQHSTILYPSPAPLGWTRSTTPQRERRLKGGSAKKRRINLLGLIGYPCSHARVRVPAGYAATAGPRTLRDGHLSWFTPANAGHPQSAPIFRDTSSRSRSRNNKSKPVARPNGNRLRTSWNRYFSWAVLDVGRMG